MALMAETPVSDMTGNKAIIPTIWMICTIQIHLQSIKVFELTQIIQ